MRSTLAIAAAALLVLAGCSSQGSQDPADATTTVTATAANERGSYVTDKTGGRDPEALREFHPDGQVLPAATLDELAQSICRALAAGNPPDEVGDIIADTGQMSRGEATVFSMSANLEYCPDLA